ncbi:MAG: hypothetical protein HYT69_00965 [Candidatus Zambryskibacteria bacterium]|nr:hypothetical protein [Candidatus Zambryskibacteria bacterium]
MIKKLFIFTALFLFSVSFVAAQGAGNPGGGGAGNPPGCTSTICLENPFKVGNTLFQLLETVVNNIILPIGGVLAVLAFIYSGFLYVTAQGNQIKLDKAHKALLYTAIGTAILLGSWVLAGVIRGTINQLI